MMPSPLKVLDFWLNNSPHANVATRLSLPLLFSNSRWSLQYHFRHSEQHQISRKYVGLAASDCEESDQGLTRIQEERVCHIVTFEFFK